MNDVAIHVEGLGKRYRIGRALERRSTLAETLTPSASSFTRAVGSLLRRRPTLTSEITWALKDVTFTVRRGEKLGIIGQNGAGKSTLLKVLSRIVEPSTGSARIHGRVGSLLEVGTGFHSELSGRENIFLNGAILGMKHREISRKFDEIVEFSEVGKYIDTPVKRYSSGMYLRLAFAVAAHLEPEILIVDEVLAVGDASFQKKCLGKMDEVAREGRTVLFVSHNMDAIRRLCGRALWLKNGCLFKDGAPGEVTSQYLMESLERGAPGRWIDVSQAQRAGTGEARFESLCYRNPDPHGPIPTPDGPLQLTLRISAQAPLVARSLSIVLKDSRGNRLLKADLASLGRQFDLSPGINEVEVSFEELHLNPGSYILALWLARNIEDETPFDYLESAVTVEVVGQTTGDYAFPWAKGPVTCRFAMQLLASDADEPNVPEVLGSNGPVPPVKARP